MRKPVARPVVLEHLPVTGWTNLARLSPAFDPVERVETHHADLAAGYTRASWTTTCTSILVVDQIASDREACEVHQFTVATTDAGRRWRVNADQPSVRDPRRT